MKRLISFILVAVLALPLLAEEQVVTKPREKKVLNDYSEWLPKQGDFSLAFSLDPIATFVGNMFNGNLSNGLGNLAGKPLLDGITGAPMVSVMGTYMQTDQLAWKVNLGIGYTHKSNNEYVLDDAALFLDPLSRVKVVDTQAYNRIYGSIALGAEYRVGKNLPVQGVFGAGLNYAFGEISSKYNYGNAITELNQIPSISEPALYEAVAGYMPNARPLNTQANNLIHMVGAYASVGMEWFVAPKIALGANVNFGIYYEVNPSRATIYEGWNTATMQVEQFTELVAPASHGFHIGTDNIGANLYMAFYF
jgi:hypothetical protein